MDSGNTAKLYDGDGGNAQTEFILDSEVGWEQVVNNPNLHVTEGVSEYEYLKTLLPKHRTGEEAPHPVLEGVGLEDRRQPQLTCNEVTRTGSDGMVCLLQTEGGTRYSSDNSCQTATSPGTARLTGREPCPRTTRSAGLL